MSQSRRSRHQGLSHGPVEAPPQGDPASCTLLSLVRMLDADAGRSEADVVRAARQLIRSRRVVLCGNFRGCRI